MNDREFAFELAKRLTNLIRDPDARKALRLLMEKRVDGAALVDHQTIQVSDEDYSVSILGMLNGAIGVIPDGDKKDWGWLSATFATSGDLCGFGLTEGPDPGVDSVRWFRCVGVDLTKELTRVEDDDGRVGTLLVEERPLLELISMTDWTPGDVERIVGLGVGEALTFDNSFTITRIENRGYGEDAELGSVTSTDEATMLKAHGISPLGISKPDGYCLVKRGDEYRAEPLQ